MAGIKPSGTVSDLPYDSDLWEGIKTQAPSKNALRDLFESADFFSASLQIKLTAGEDISAIRVVRSSLTGSFYAKSNGTYEEANAVGISYTSALTGNLFTVVTHGLMEDSSFSTYTINKEIYLSTNGTLTQTAPLTGFLLTVGKYIGQNIIVITIKDPIERA